ncbi:TPA: hypothetical protein PTV74_003394 [Clostridium botulinum]|nr:hypothetical protein [Clostridium botulinum]HDK7206546.1 hypothetical protein [Clostridium botulinum]HDK7210281.1 hypothetical protein [Clostridium botulinum]HDK7265731.1 hypothetical protein [Clostridium botulinum]HDK7269578.1 hypothetical protein [Clostridium botulinum]
MNEIYLTEAFDKYVNPMFFNMYVVAVQSGRLPIESLPPIYKERVNKLLNIEKENKQEEITK